MQNTSNSAMQTRLLQTKFFLGKAKPRTRVYEGYWHTNINMVTHLKIHNKGSKNTKEIFCGGWRRFFTKEFHCFSELLGGLFLQAQQVVQFPFSIIDNALEVSKKTC